MSISKLPGGGGARPRGFWGGTYRLLLFGAPKTAAHTDYYFFRQGKIHLGLGLDQKMPEDTLRTGAAGAENGKSMSHGLQKCKKNGAAGARKKNLAPQAPKK